jgi:hypothetical protein
MNAIDKRKLHIEKSGMLAGALLLAVVAITLIHSAISWLFSYPVYYYGSATTFNALEAQGIKPHCTTLDSSSPFRSFMPAVQSFICFDTRQEIELYIVSPTSHP